MTEPENELPDNAKIFLGAIASASLDLERIANSLHFFGLKELPEYQKAIDALREYEKAALAEIERLDRLGEAYKARENKNQRQWKEQRDYVVENWEKIAGEYGEEYIAVKDRAVIDHDKEQFRLIERVLRRFPNEDDYVFVSTLDDILNPKDVHIPPPKCETPE